MQKIESFSCTWGRAVERKGGEVELRDALSSPLSASELGGLPDAYFLEIMSKCIFQAGFSWKVVDKKWPGFEEVFHGFEPETLTTLSEQEWEAFARETRIIRNPQKIKAVRGNLWFVMDITMEYGGFGQFLADWPVEETVDLFRRLKQDGSRLGGATGQRFLRFAGKDTFILTGDVVKSLQRAGLEIANNPTSKRDMASIQAAFNQWRAETGMPLQHLSMIMARSVGENYGID